MTLLLLAIATAAMEMLGGQDITKNCRKPDIMADAAYAVFLGRSTGNFYIDESLLKEHGVTDFDQYAVDPTQPLTPDFFLPEDVLRSFPDYDSAVLYSEASKGSSGTATSSASSPTENVFSKIKTLLNEEVVKKTSGMYAFHITGAEKEVWYVDMKSGAGCVGKGEPPTGKADVTFTSDNETFLDMFTGKLKPTSAFMSGKLKLKGDMSLAMKLEKLMSRMKSKL